MCGCTSTCQASTSADPKKNVLTMNACVQNQKQQLKSWEQNSPSHMQMVQQQQPFSLQGDPDTKMPQITGFDHDRQQLATAMAGACHDDSCLMIPGLQSCKLALSTIHATTSQSATLMRCIQGPVLSLRAEHLCNAVIECLQKLLHDHRCKSHLYMHDWTQSTCMEGCSLCHVHTKLFLLHRQPRSETLPWHCCR